MKPISIIFLSIFVLITGCSTVSYQKPSEVLPGYSKIHVYRKYASPTAWSLNFEFDGKKIAKIAQHDNVEFSVPPGKRTFSINWPFLAGGVKVSGVKEIEPNTSYYFFIDGEFEHDYVTYTNSIQLREVTKEHWLSVLSN